MSCKYKKVAVTIDMSASAPAREVLTGIFQFANASCAWSIQVIQTQAAPIAVAVAQAMESNVDGLIVTTLADEESNRLVAETHLPTVFVDVSHPLFEARTKSVAFVRNDNERIGSSGARYLASLGQFNSFGYVPDVAGRAFSVVREKTFVQEIRQLGRRAHVFRGGSDVLSEDGSNLCAWLSRLPKPAAVMAAFDFRAVQVHAACVECGLDIPGQVAILGVDNDELLCNSTVPAISSIKPAHVDEGFRAAVELQRLFRLGARAKRREVFCRSYGVVERESTKSGPPSAALIRRALSFIDANATTNLQVGTVAEGVGVSRRLLEKRFREVRKETVHRRILVQRLAIVKRLLRTTTRTCARIARECGFPNANALSHIFAREVGCSMREYRASKAQVSSGSPEEGRS